MAGFSKLYGLKRLVHLEEFREITAALAREKQLKGWLRRKKIDLIQFTNPRWGDLAEGWYEKNSHDGMAGDSDASGAGMDSSLRS